MRDRTESFNEQIAQFRVVGEFNSILASRFVVFDYLITLSARQHIRRNRQADLLGCLEVDGQFKL
jgi:hypothetical protein